jgi:hypothetical protein
MRSRRFIIIAALLVALAVVLVIRSSRDAGDTSAAPRATSDRSAPHTDTVSARPASPNLASDVSATGHRPAPATDQTSPAPPPPPPAQPTKTGRPAPQPVTQEELVARRESGLELLDDTIARVTRERDEATKTGDTERVALTRVRLERLASVRKQRAQELEEARRGELQPNPDDMPAGPKPESAP